MNKAPQRTRHSASWPNMLCAVLVLSWLSAAIADANPHKSAVMQPIMDMSGGNIKACGIGFDLEFGKHKFSLLLINEAATNETQTKLIANSNPPSKIVKAELRTDTSTTLTHLNSVITKSDHQRVVGGTMSPGENARLFQAILVRGAEIRLETDIGKLTWTVQGPASQSVRAMYLMCSGDLYRP